MFPSRAEYRDQRRWHTFKFRQYRRYEHDYDQEVNRRHWTNIRLPVANVTATPWEAGRQNWAENWWTPDPVVNKMDTTTDESQLPDDRRPQYRKLQKVKAFIGSVQDVDYVRCLGIGGQGLAALCRYRDPVTAAETDFVIKVDQGDDLENPKKPSSDTQSWVSWFNRLENREMQKLDRAEHIVQTIPRNEVGLPLPGPNMPKGDMPVGLDSEDGLRSDSGDDSPGPRPARNRARIVRSQITPAQQRARTRAWNRRNDAGWKEWVAYIRAQRKAGTPHRDYMVLEYVKNGSLFDLCCRIREKDRPPPNRVLWSFWLCLVRGCVGLQYWPRKFHPDRKNPVPVGQSRDLREELPPLSKRWRRKNLVHFDIDPQNIFIGERDPDDTEHSLVPKLKLADFGLVQEVRKQKRDAYYTDKRNNAKPGYFAPEQFNNKWDAFGIDPHSADISTYAEGRADPVAGNYSPAINIWGIALTMFNLMTGFLPPRPPQPARLRPVRGGPLDLPAGFITYGNMLLDDRWDRYDLELRAIVARCMAHNPKKRPDLEELLESAINGQAKPFPNESKDEVERWLLDMRLITFSPTPSPSTSYSSIDSDGGGGSSGGGSGGSGGGDSGNDNGSGIGSVDVDDEEEEEEDKEEGGGDDDDDNDDDEDGGKSGDNGGGGKDGGDGKDPGSGGDTGQEGGDGGKNPGGGPGGDTGTGNGVGVLDDDGIDPAEVVDYFGYLSDELKTFTWGRYLLPTDHPIEKDGNATFANGWTSSWTDPTDHESGFEVLRDSLLGQMRPTIQSTGLPTANYFQQLFYKVLGNYSGVAGFAPGQVPPEILGAIIYEWGVEKGVNIQLGFSLNDNTKFVVPTPSFGPGAKTLWIRAKDVQTLDPETQVMTPFTQYATFIPKSSPQAIA